ncbi:MAG: FGGY-family carbohydrate kinase [Promicromonosporaceae bacterium]|nr:FGGY-family carbohydrate kinase [Promicromonosporaceae bacterium]
MDTERLGSTSPVSEADVATLAAITAGQVTLGVELGSTNIKACLIGPDQQAVAVGEYTWENQFVDRVWTYSLDAVHTGLAGAFAALSAEVRRRYDLPLTQVAAIGVSAMMHGYLAFDSKDELLTPFRTWRNTSTGPAAAALTEVLGFNIPLRWSVAHFYQAALDGEEHVRQVASLTTLAGYVHRRLTGRNVLGVGDASGMFPIDPETCDFDEAMLAKLDAILGGIRHLLPEVLPAGANAGTLTAEGAALLDPTGTLQPGALLCPPEGDAGTGMVATNAVAPRTGNVSVGTSVFAMVVLERALSRAHPEIDVVTTPAGAPVAMVHCNNGASELGAWASVFGEFAQALGAPANDGAVFAALLGAALNADPDGGGLLAFNFLSGEHNIGLDEGRPLMVRTPGSTLNLANFARTQVYAVFATLALGMQTLAEEGVALDSLLAHGGLFRTAGVAQRLLAAAVNAPVSVASMAGEGGAWGAAVLAAYAHAVAGGETRDLGAWLAGQVFADAATAAINPDPVDAAGFAAYLARFKAALPLQHTAVKTTR